MKIDNLSLPHPVLSQNGSVQGAFKSKIIREIDANEVVLRVNSELENEYLAKLINDKKAAFCLDITCSTTFYRTAFLSYENNFIATIPTSMLRDGVEVGSYILATEAIPGYTNEYNTDIYENVTFDLSEGDILAYAGRDDFQVPKKWEAGSSGGAFFMIWKHNNKEIFYQLGNDPILIYLSEEDYNTLKPIKKNDSLRQVYLTLYAYPALVYVLTMIFSDNTESYSSRKWYRRINDILDEKRFEGIEKTIENAPRIAQMIFQFPLSRSLKDLNSVIREFEGS